MYGKDKTTVCYGMTETSTPLYVPPSLYAQLQERGYDMRQFVAQEPLPAERRLSLAELSVNSLRIDRDRWKQRAQARLIDLQVLRRKIDEPTAVQRRRLLRIAARRKQGRVTF